MGRPLHACLLRECEVDGRRRGSKERKKRVTSPEAREMNNVAFLTIHDGSGEGGGVDGLMKWIGWDWMGCGYECFIESSGFMSGSGTVAVTQ